MNIKYLPNKPKSNFYSLFVGGLFFIFSSLFFLPPHHVSAQQTAGDIAKNTLDSSFVSETGVTKVGIGSAIAASVTIILGLLGIIFFILAVYAGYLWTTAQGDESRIGEAKQTIIRASLGFFVVISSYALSSFITTQFAQQAVRAPEDGGSDTDPSTIGPVGCCLDRTSQTGRPGKTGAGTWTDRMATQAECSTMGEDANDPGDVRYGPGTWGWQSVESLSSLGVSQDSATTCEALRRFQRGDTYQYPSEAEWIEFMSDGVNGRQSDGSRI